MPYKLLDSWNWSDSTESSFTVFLIGSRFPDSKKAIFYINSCKYFVFTMQRKKDANGQKKISLGNW